MDDANGMKIKITRDGPYEVSGHVRLNRDSIVTDERGDSVAWDKGREYVGPEEPYHLCRCGHSRNKPYCDGSHNDVGFCGKERAERPSYREEAQVQRGEGCDLLDAESLCIGARFCDRGDTVWGLVEKSGSEENKRAAIEEACNCPSGRLTIADSDGRLIEPELEPEISLIQDPANECRGPLWVKGGIEIEGADGEKYEVRNRVTLCRCGQSKNQPFCDGQHYYCEEMQGLDP